VVLGLGVSHAPLVEVRGHRYERPFARMVEYLDGMDSAPYQSVPPTEKPARVLAALGPKMLRLAGERAAGALTYLVTPDATAQARSLLGAGPMLGVAQAVVLTKDATEARRVGRRYLEFYLALPNYLKPLKALGFSDADLGGGGTDHLVDTLVPWGSAERIAAVVKDHHDAGADHVCLQVLDDQQPDGQGLPAAAWRELSLVLTG